jgi:hypothetical protein
MPEPLRLHEDTCEVVQTTAVEVGGNGSYPDDLTDAQKTAIREAAEQRRQSWVAGARKP